MKSESESDSPSLSPCLSQPVAPPQSLNMLSPLSLPATQHSPASKRSAPARTPPPTAKTTTTKANHQHAPHLSHVPQQISTAFQLWFTHGVPAPTLKSTSPSTSQPSAPHDRILLCWEHCGCPIQAHFLFNASFTPPHTVETPTPAPAHDDLVHLPPDVWIGQPNNSIDILAHWGGFSDQLLDEEECALKLFTLWDPYNSASLFRMWQHLHISINTSQLKLLPIGLNLGFTASELLRRPPGTLVVAVIMDASKGADKSSNGILETSGSAHSGGNGSIGDSVREVRVRVQLFEMAANGGPPVVVDGVASTLQVNMAIRPASSVSCTANVTISPRFKLTSRSVFSIPKYEPHKFATSDRYAGDVSVASAFSQFIESVAAHLTRAWRARQHVFDALCEECEGILLERDMVDQSKAVFLFDSSSSSSRGDFVGIVTVEFDDVSGPPSVSISPVFPPGAQAIRLCAEDYNYNSSWRPSQTAESIAIIIRERVLAAA